MIRLFLDPNAAPGSAPPAPSNGPPKSAVELASDAARASIAQHGTAIPGQAPVAPDPDAAARRQAASERAQSTVRPDGGRFGSDRVREIPAADEEARDPGQRPAPQAGQPPASENPPVPEPEPQPAASEPAEGDDVDEPAIDEGEGNEEGITDERDPRTVVIQGGRTGEEYELTFADERQANAIRHLQKQAGRVREIEQLQERAIADQAQVQQLRTEIEMDPAGFLLDSFPQEPELLAHIAKYLVTRPELQQHLRPILEALDDPSSARVLRLEVENERFTMRDRFQSYAQETRAIDENFRQLTQAVANLTPEGITTAQREQFRVQCLKELQTYADRHNQLTLPIDDVPLILRARLESWGINPIEAAQKLAGKPKTKGPPAARRSPNGSPPAPVRGQPAVQGGPPSAPGKTGKQFVQGSRVKRDAASVPGPGAGAPGTSDLTPPPGMSIEQTTAWHREQLAKRRTATTAGQRTA